MGKHPKNLSHEIVGRIPIRLNRNESYVNLQLKFMPKNGYTKMFEKNVQ